MLLCTLHLLLTSCKHLASVKYSKLAGEVQLISLLTETGLSTFPMLSPIEMPLFYKKVQDLGKHLPEEDTFLCSCWGDCSPDIFLFCCWTEISSLSLSQSPGLREERWSDVSI